MVLGQDAIIARIGGREVEVGGLLADLCRGTSGLVHIVQAQHRLLVDLPATLDHRERTIADLEEWIGDAQKALQKAEEIERALGCREHTGDALEAVVEKLIQPLGETSDQEADLQTAIA